ncbi:MAG TPA: hypothetical protein VK003_08010 [Oceanobacillus sp.]|nr:hypothetical protein [Oceanobacillus sp.]
MLDDLRRSAFENEPDDFDSEDDTFTFDDVSRPERQFLGMSAIERMFLSIFFFMNVLVIGVALLLATGRLAF